MRIAIIGAGIVGVCTAYELAIEGHEVSVFERSGGVAGLASFGHAGLISPAQVAPWPVPRLGDKALAQWPARPTPVTLQTRLDLGLWRWLWQWRQASRLPGWQAKRTQLQALARLSRDRLLGLTHELRLDHEHARGSLTLLRDDRDLAHARPGLALMAELGTRFVLLDAEHCRALEPGLGTDTPLRAGIHLPEDEIGNGRQFAHLLRTEAQRAGATFRFHTTVQAIAPGPTPHLVHRQTPAEDARSVATETTFGDAPVTVPMPAEPITEAFDSIVVCNALGAPALLQPHGLKLPLRAVHGYSVTAPLRHEEQHPDRGPRACVIDARHQVTISRLGQRVRVAGMAEFGGSAESFDENALATLYQVLHDWFPGAARLNQAQRWKGARSLLPDGMPLIGRSGLDGIWMSLGHGTHGWALASGSARVLADQIGGRSPTVDVQGFDPRRLG